MEAERCGFQIPDKDLIGSYGGWCCLRDTWDGNDRCIWHTEQRGKPIDELSAALRSERDRTGADHYPRLDYAKLSHLEIPEPDYESDAPVGPSLSFGRVTLIGADFKYGELRSCSFDSTIAHLANFEETDLTYQLLQSGEFRECNFRYATLKGVGTNHARFDGADFTGADLTDANLVFSDAQDADFRYADLTETYMHDVDLENAVLEEATLDQTDLTGANLEGAQLHKAIVRDIRIDETTVFGGVCWYERTADEAIQARSSSEDTGNDGEKLSQAPAWLASISRFRSRLKQAPPSGERTPPLTKAIRVYRLYQRVFRENSLPEPARQFRIRERHARRKRALEENSYREWGSLALQRWTILYGEGIGRVITASVASILLFGILYPIWGVNAGSTVVQYGRSSLTESVMTGLYFSAVTFSTLGYGDVQPLGHARGIAAFEALLGAVLVALLVFVFGRRTAW